LPLHYAVRRTGTKGQRTGQRGTAIFLISPNEKLIFLENISTKDDVCEEVLFKKDNGRGNGAPPFF
jgi:hypothetical protein